MTFIMDRFKMIASAYLLYIRNGRILLSQRKNTGYEDGKYSVPAGHIEEEESLTAGACREFLEETGLRFNANQLTLVHVMHRKEQDIRMDFFFTAKNTSQEPKNLEPGKCSDLSWFLLQNLPSNTIPYIRQAIESYRKKIFFSERGFGIIDQLAGSLHTTVPYMSQSKARKIVAKALAKRYI